MLGGPFQTLVYLKIQSVHLTTSHLNGCSTNLWRWETRLLCCLGGSRTHQIDLPCCRPLGWWTLPHILESTHHVEEKTSCWGEDKHTALSHRQWNHLNTWVSYSFCQGDFSPLNSQATIVVQWPIKNIPGPFSLRVLARKNTPAIFTFHHYSKCMILHRFMIETSQGICAVYFIVYA